MREEFQKHPNETNVSGSGNASSYLKALDYLAQMIAAEPLGFEDCQDIWSVTSIDRLNQFYEATNEQKHLGPKSIWIIKGIARSYLQSGYCTAAIRAYQEFQVQRACETDLLQRNDSFTGKAAELPKRLQRKLTIPKHLLETWSGQEGKNTTRTIQAGFFHLPPQATTSNEAYLGQWLPKVRPLLELTILQIPRP